MGPTGAESVGAGEETGACEVVLRRNPRARRYTIRVKGPRLVCVTIPRGGSRREAMRFVEKSRDWIEAQRRRRAEVVGHAEEWPDGVEILFRGEWCRLEVRHDLGRPFVELGGHRIFLADAAINLKRPVEAFLKDLARRELPGRTRQLAERQGIAISRVSVRNQSSRWGSCSSRGVISLNWRLVQTPGWVCDYVIIHELMHRREMNHSARFWRLVDAACPRWREAEVWLDGQAFQLGMG